jgi:predicted Holliday junction resolvase-like endonuclease
MKLKWIIWTVVICLIISGIAYYEIKRRIEASKIEDKKQEIISELEKADIEHNQNETRLYRLLAEKDSRNNELVKKYENLENQIKNIIVPADPNSLVDAWKKHGIRSRIIRSSPPPGR